MVAGDADKPGLALLLGPAERLQGPAGRAQGLHLRHGPHIMDLPEVQVVGVQVPQGGGQVLLGLPGVRPWDLLVRKISSRWPLRPCPGRLRCRSRPGRTRSSGCRLPGPRRSPPGRPAQSHRCAAPLLPPDPGWWPVAGAAQGAGGYGHILLLKNFYHQEYQGHQVSPREYYLVSLVSWW